MDILDQMEAWRKNARFISEQDFFSRMMFEIIKNRKEIERLREALRNVLSVQPIKGDEGSTDIISLAKALLEIDSIARIALREDLSGDVYSAYL